MRDRISSITPNLHGTMNEEPRLMWIGCLLLPLITASPVAAEDILVTGIKAVHRHGQTFVTWRDAGEGDEGAKFRYSLYSSDAPITANNLAQADLCFRGVLNNSAKLYGSAFTVSDRLDSSKPYAILVEGGRRLPAWSGLAVRTVQRTGKTYYAVVATDQQFTTLSPIAPGESATTQPLDEQPAAIQPIKLYDSAKREGPYVRNTAITGTKGLPLKLTLHGSQSKGGGAGGYGDYFLFFGTPQMGYRDGLAGVFSVSESHLKSGNTLLLQARDAVEHPFKLRAMETYWFGYHCVPQASAHTEPRFYPFTENQLLWMVRWAVKHYGADPNRVTVGGSSSGAVGSFNVGLRHPELFAAVYPVSGRVRRVPPTEWGERRPKGSAATMSDGITDYYDRVDGPKFVAEHYGDLPFVGWACGRHDGWATWQENVDMVRAMTAAKHGFAFSWNNGGHGAGRAAMRAVNQYYPADKFARNISYPAFGNSSLDDDMGNGDPATGDLEGGINLGFDWHDVTDEPKTWSVALSNELAKTEMTVDVTPRRCQRFKPRPGDKLSWTSSTGDQGTIVADAHGLVTIAKVKLRSGKATVLTIQP